jgi:hypothetical protein
MEEVALIGKALEAEVQGFETQIQQWITAQKKDIVAQKENFSKKIQADKGNFVFDFEKKNPIEKVK